MRGGPNRQLVIKKNMVTDKGDVVEEESYDEVHAGNQKIRIKGISLECLIKINKGK